MSLVRSGAIDGFERLISDLGANPVELLAEVGLSQAQLRNPNTYVSYSRIADLLEIAATACDEPLLGLLLSERQTSTVLGELPMMLSQQSTLQEALDNIGKYLYLHARGAHINLVPRGDDIQLQLVLEVSSARGLFQLVQMSAGQLANFVAELLALQNPTFPILLRQNQPLSRGSRLSERVLSRLDFDARIDGIHIPKKWLKRKPHYDEEALRSHFRNYMQTLQQRYPDNLQDQVRDIISQILPSGECNIERVAATLDLHPRVLQKRLQKLGSSYVQLLQETRREIAEQHLRHKSMTVTDLALNLGYAEVSVFSRNFKQWTGMSPRRWQMQQG